ncbi:MAG: YdcF family protein [Planctomycetaceae bacterium]
MFATNKLPPSFLRILFMICTFIGMVVIVLGVTQDRNVVEKVGTALVMPSGLLWILLLTLSIQLCMQKKHHHSGQSGGIAATVCFALFSVAGNGFIADHMAAALEADYLRVDPMKEAPLDVVIVLGGGSGLGANGRLQGNGSGDRLILAAQLYHQKIARKFICTGQRIALMNASGVDPAESSRDILIKLGVPDSAIEIAGGRNTSEEMQGLSKRFHESKLRIGLLTSAWHLPRAMRLANRNGLQPIPLPADFRTAANIEGLTTGQMVESMIPNGFALGATWSFAKEYLGMMLGR